MATATNYSYDLVKLHDWIETGVAQAKQTGQPVLVSNTQAATTLDPLNCFAGAYERGQTAFFWEKAEDQFSLAGAGEVLRLTGQGENRFDSIEQTWQSYLKTALITGLDKDRWGLGPILMGGFRFDTAANATANWQGYPDGQLVLPEVQVTRRNDGSFVTINLLVTSDTNPQAEAVRLNLLCTQLTTPLNTVEKPNNLTERWDVKPAENWKALVGRAVNEIKGGQFEKVVLAREVRVQAAAPLDVAEAMRRLRQKYPSAILFAAAFKGKCFLGATPERLVKLFEGEVRTTGLAGTAQRGTTEAEDQRLGAELLNSPKNLGEHAIVVRMLRSALEQVCNHVWAESEPHLLKLPNVQHLYTPVLGRLREGTGILKLVQLLHPTPALGGFPRKEALDWLRPNEDLDRGWYAAPVGWMDSIGEGEFAVAIRSALVEGSQASLFAGCGIVADSDPESEYTESCFKLKPMLTALGF